MSLPFLRGKQRGPNREAAPVSKPTVSERRAWIRYQSNLETVCEPISALSAEEAASGWPAKVRDISAGGVGLSVGRRFEPGSVLLIELTSGEDETSYVAPVRVVHATLDGDGRWILGCAFTRRLDDEQMRSLLKGQEGLEAP